MNMKDAIANYVSPDFTDIETRLTKLEKGQETIVTLVQQNQDMVRAVRSDLKSDIDRVEAAVDAAERRGRELDRDTRSFVNNSDKRLGDTERDLQSRIRNVERETDAKLRELEKKVDDKIKKAWENPLAK
jgi:Skp family chaperone for outer membrane proteins